MDSTLMSSGFAQPDGSSDAARPSDQGNGSGDGAPTEANDGSNAALAQQQNLLQQQFQQQDQQQQQQQQPMNNMFMGNASLQQAFPGFGNGVAGDGSANLFGMNMGQNFLMQPQQQPQQLQQQHQLFSGGGFPQGLTPQMFGSPPTMIAPQQTQAPANGTELDQSSNQGNAQQQQLGIGGNVPNQLPQFQQNGGGMPNIQQLQQLVMAQQLFAAQGGAGGGGSMPGGMAPNFSTAASFFPFAANNPLMGNLMGQTTQFMGPVANAGPGGMWSVLAQPQMVQQPQQLMNQGGNAAAMNFFLSGLAANNQNAAAMMPQQQQTVPHQQALPQQPVSTVQALAADGKSEEWAEPFFGKGKKEPPFPLKLHQILGNPEFAECISWNAHGRSWRILKPPVFEQIVIPLYFRHAKYASFMRQVNGWGFKRIVSGNDHNSYYHECFVRENPQMCLKMKRIKKRIMSSKAKKGGGDGDSDDDESKVESDDEVTLDKKSGQPVSLSLPSNNTVISSIAVPNSSGAISFPNASGAGVAPQHQPFQQMDMMNVQSPALFAAALQNMQGGGGGMPGASAFQNSSFPSMNQSIPMNGLPNSTDSQWALASGMLGGNSGSAIASGMAASPAGAQPNGNTGNGSTHAFPTSNSGISGAFSGPSDAALLSETATGPAGARLLPPTNVDLSTMESSLMAKLLQQQQHAQQTLGQVVTANTNAPATSNMQHAKSVNNISSGGAPQPPSATYDEDAGDDDDDEEDDDESGEFGSEDGSSDSEV